MHALMLLPLLASANYAIYAWAAAVPVVPAFGFSANATIVMANFVTNVTSAEPVEYRIPGTTTTVHFLLFEPLERLAMANAIESTYEYIQEIVASKGDSLLPAEEDPFIYNKGYGAYVEVWSAGTQLMTWSFLEGAVVAIHNALYLRGKFRTLSFTIWDARVGTIALGNLSKGVIPMVSKVTATIESNLASKSIESA